jgi:hypothetical protein
VWTADRILKHGGQTNAICQLCRSQPESALHILAKCPYSRVVWAGLSAWLGFNLQPSPMHSYHRIRSWWNDMIQQGGQGPRSAWTASEKIIYTAWNLWKERCRRVFDNIAVDAFQIPDPRINQRWCTAMEGGMDPWRAAKIAAAAGCVRLGKRLFFSMCEL